MLRFARGTYLSALFRLTLSERLSASLWGSDVLQLLKFISIVLILYYICIECIKWLYTFFSNITCLIQIILFDGFNFVSFQMHYLMLIAPVLMLFFWNICLGVHILSPLTFCLLKSRTFLRISIILSELSFSEFVFLKTRLFIPLNLFANIYFSSFSGIF